MCVPPWSGREGFSLIVGQAGRGVPAFFPETRDVQAVRTPFGSASAPARSLQDKRSKRPFTSPQAQPDATTSSTLAPIPTVAWGSHAKPAPPGHLFLESPDNPTPSPSIDIKYL